MWSDLSKELEAIKLEAFGKKYLEIRKSRQLGEVENHFLYLVAYVIANQSADGWWNVGQQYQKLITAHAVRLLHKMGLPLKARWNLSLSNSSEEGNLYRAVKLLIGAGSPPDNTWKNAWWGDDTWDDCYILLALLEARTDPQWDKRLEAAFNRKYLRSLRRLVTQVKDDGFDEQVRKAPWYGPGFYAAAMELFDHPSVEKELASTKELPDSAQLIETLSRTVKPLLARGLEHHDEVPWCRRFPWHVGQCIVTWKEKREKYPPLRELDELMGQAYVVLRKTQSENGAWDDGGRIIEPDDVIYYTVRALSGCYVWEGRDATASPTIWKAHAYLLEVARHNENSLLVNLKASINAIGAYQRLFEFRLPNVFPNLLLLLLSRLDCLGLLSNVLTPGENEVKTLKRVRACARIKLEDQGFSVLELNGVNDRLYSSLKHNESFLKEFSCEPEQTLRELRRFLSSTLTETRSKSSRRLITYLWTTNGFLNFIPLIEHLSSLEQDRAFYKYYRDHLNHEVLLFLLGAYIYFNCSNFRDKINEEIVATYQPYAPPFGDDKLVDEFLFRWKLISTFHDIGYLFEVDPVQEAGSERSRDELLIKSFKVVDEARANFLLDYFMQNLTAGGWAGREAEIRELVGSVAGSLPEKYDQPIRAADDLFAVRTGGSVSDAFELMSKHIRSEFIHGNFLKEYFDLCRTTPVYIKGKKLRDPFLDHGIMSALVLLKSADVQRFYLKRLVDLEFYGQLNVPQALAKVLGDAKTRERLEPAHFYIRFSHVAGAIALHNVSPRMYTREQCVEFDRRPDKHEVSIESSFYTEPLGTAGRYAIGLDENPMAYLTTLADMLQDWDRHSFRRISFGENSGDPLASSEVIIKFNERNKIHVIPLSHDARFKYKELTGTKGFGDFLLDWDKYLELEEGGTELSGEM